MGGVVALPASGPAFPSYDVLGVPVSVVTLESASAAIEQWAEDRHGRFVCIRDVHGIMQARNDDHLRSLHRAAAMVTPDGMPLVWIGRKRGLSVSRTCGPDLMAKVMADSEVSGVSHYFYGGKPGVAERLASVFADLHPALRVNATETPPFRELDADEIRSLARRIEDSSADVVWIGLSTPKQERLMEKLAPLVSATLIGVGAAFDFHTGAVRRAPSWMQRSGLEWSFRLMSEPRRLWRRYLIMAPKFVLALARARGR